MSHPADPAVSGFAWSPTADPASDWWTQCVFFDGKPTRRFDVAAAFARTPGATDAAVRAFLASAEVADAHAEARPPWYWDARVYFDGVPTPRRAVCRAMAAAGVPEAAIRSFLDTAAFADGKGDLDPAGRWITIGGHHTHITKDGEPDAGGPAPVRAALAKGKAARPGDDNREFQKAIREGQKTEAKHQGTIDKLAAGKKVADKALQATHDHYKDSHGWHTESLKKAGGPDGKPVKGQEWEHGFHKESVEKIGASLKATSGELKKRADDKKLKEATAARDKFQKADGKHDATYQKVQAGEKVGRKQLQAAHDHYKGRYDADADLLYGMAGKNGKDLHKVPADRHAALADSLIDAADRQDKLKGHLDAHDKAKAEADKAKADTSAARVEKAKAKPAKEPKADAKPAEPKAAEGSKLSAHEIRQGLQMAFGKASDGGYASMPRLFEEAQKYAPGLTKEQFHEHALALEKAGHLELHEHDNPSKLHPDDAAMGINGGAYSKGGADATRLKYYAMKGRHKDAPWARGPHDGAADAAQKLIDSGSRNASPPSRSDLFSALAHNGNMSPTAAGAAAREIHGKLADTGAVSQDEVREAVHRHSGDDEKRKQDAATAAVGKGGTNHAAGASLSSLYEAKTGRSGHAPGQVGKKDLPSKEEVAKHIETATHGRLAGDSALRAAKDIHAHVLAHGHDFLSNHDFAGVLDRHAKNDYKHSAPADVARAARSGEVVHPKHLERAQNEASESYQKVAAARHRLLDKAPDGDSSKLQGKDREKWNKLSSQMAQHGDHIDATNDALIRHREGDLDKVETSHQEFDAARDKSGSDHDLVDDPKKAKAHADAFVEQVKQSHTPKEIHELAKRATGKKGKAKDGSDSLRLIHNDLTAVSRLRETQRV